MNKTLTKVLTTVIEGTNSEQGYALITDKQAEALVAEGMVETNAEIRDGNKIAARATAQGIATMNDTTTSETTETTETASVSTGFALIDNAELPAGRGGGGGGKYPFDQMGEGQSFFVASTEERPNPAKSLASTVSSANKRILARDGEGAAKFGVKAVEAGKIYGEFTAPSNGALVKRIA